MKNGISKEWREFRLLLRSVPPLWLTAMVVSVIAMNLLANKSVNLPFSWLALDCGIIVSWICFLAMDTLTRHFGPKAATELSVVAVATNLVACLLFYLASRIPGTWGESYVESGAAVNLALDNTFGGTWYVLMGSTIAFLVSAVVNNFLNAAIGRWFRKNPDGFAAYACRTYLSTAAGQFVDNLTFALIVSHFFFGWTLTQCLTCAATGMVAELLCEVLFSRYGYAVCRRWREQDVGREYLELRKGKAA